MNNLLENIKSKSGHQHKKFSIPEDELEVALAWLREEISITQIRKVINKSSGSSYWWLLSRIREAYRKDLLK